MTSHDISKIGKRTGCTLGDEKLGHSLGDVRKNRLMQGAADAVVFDAKSGKWRLFPRWEAEDDGCFLRERPGKRFSQGGGRSMEVIEKTHSQNADLTKICSSRFGPLLLF